MSIDNYKVVAFFSDVRAGTSMSFASMTLLIYDHILNFGDEVELIWKPRKWSRIGFIYLCVRYLSILNLSMEFVVNRLPYLLRAKSRHCKSYLEGQGLFSTFIVLVIDVILVFRVWILYSRDKKLLCFLAFLLLSEWTIVTTILTKISFQEGLFIQPGTIGGISVCYFTGPIPSYFKYYAVAMLSFASIVFALSLYRCSSILRGNDWQRLPVVSMFFRDSLVWYLAVLVVLLSQLVLLTNSKSELAAAVLDPSVVVHSIAGSRVLLNIKASIAETESGVGDEEDQTRNLHTIRFGSSTEFSMD